MKILDSEVHDEKDGVSMRAKASAGLDRPSVVYSRL